MSLMKRSKYCEADLDFVRFSHDIWTRPGTLQGFEVKHVVTNRGKEHRDFFRFLHYEIENEFKNDRIAKSILELNATQVSELFRIIDQARIPRVRKEKIPSLLGDTSTWRSDRRVVDGTHYKLEIAFCSRTSEFQWWSLAGKGIEDLISIRDKLIELKKIARPIPLGKKGRAEARREG